jgi:serine/threonine protein kinase
VSPGDPASIKIADFGFAKVVGDLKKDANGAQLMMTSCGTPEYVAPEVLKNVGYGVSCDIWSMGIILYIMLCGFPPFYNESMPKLFDDIMKKPHEYPSPEWDPISDDAKDLLNQMMAKDPAQVAVLFSLPPFLPFTRFLPFTLPPFLLSCLHPSCLHPSSLPAFHPFCPRSDAIDPMPIDPMPIDPMLSKQSELF